jgi:ABC-type Fe3+ transport system permease subunit
MTSSRKTAKRPFRAVHPLAPWLFVGPAVLLSLAMIVAPFLYSIYQSLRGVKVAGGGLGRREEVFVGFGNYVSAIFNAELWAGFGRMLYLGIITVPLTLGLALLFALLLDTPRLRLAVLAHRDFCALCRAWRYRLAHVGFHVSPRRQPLPRTGRIAWSAAAQLLHPRQRLLVDRQYQCLGWRRLQYGHSLHRAPRHQRRTL